MTRRKAPTDTSLKLEVPETLSGHRFYGLKLDEYQEEFRDAIWNPEKRVIFCNAKAGSGKTIIATATANLLCQYGLQDGIVYIVSPTQERRQGFLSGSIEEKSEPYFEPFYDALLKIGVNCNTAFYNNITNEKNGTAYLRCTTNTFLRGVNFENKVIIIDECQNFTVDELRTTITRCHDNVKLICIGHDRQCDLENKSLSGFKKYLSHFESSANPCVAVCNLEKNYRGWISSWADTYVDR